MDRELDKAIAEALGYELLAPIGGVLGVKMGKEEHPCGGHYTVTDYLPEYSTNAFAMLDLETEMRKRGYQLHVSRVFPTCDEAPDRYAACYYKPGNNEENFSTDGCMSINSLPKAMALAAYHALTGNKWRPEDVDAEFWSYVRGEKPDRKNRGV